MSITSSVAISTPSRLGELIWFRYEFTFSPSGHVVVLRKAMIDQATADIDVATLTASIEAETIEQSRLQSMGLLNAVSLIIEEVTPDFPDELPESDGDESVDTRRREFHRWLLRHVWPEDLRYVTDHFLDVWTWIDQMSAPNIRTYLGVNVATYNSITQRMGNSLTHRELYNQDEPGRIS